MNPQMKNRMFSTKFIAIFSYLLFIAAVQNGFAQFSINESPLPAPTAPVNDFANVIDDAVERQLNQKIIQFKARTNPQVVLAVAIIKTTNGRPIEDYAIATYRGWKIGTSADDNPGALLLVAIDDRKYFTEVSKDLEDELPDGLVGQLQREYLVPAFKKGDYTKGVADTIDAYIRTIEAKQSGEPIPQTSETKQKEKSPVSSSSLGICLIIGVILLILILSRAGKSSRNRNDRDRWGGGGFGGGGSALPWIVGSIIANSGSNSSSSSDWGGSSGGSDWGGFGGGGDSAGGGAGGDW